MSAVGTLQGRFAYVRFGNGPAPLVVLPGLAFDNDAPGRLRSPALRLVDAPPGRRAHRHRPAAAARDRQRPPRASSAPPTSPTCTRGVLTDEPGPVDVMGLSTGGLIAQHLALRHPGLVRRLVLAVSGARIAEARPADLPDVAGPGRAAGLARAARRLDWPRRSTGRTTQRLARLLGGSGRRPDPRDVADFAGDRPGRPPARHLPARCRD